MFHWRQSQNHQENDSSQKDAKVHELKAAVGPLSGRSLQFCTDACLRRYLEASNWNVDKSKKMLQETLKWRSTYKPEETRWDEVAHEGETGKVSRADFHDRLGRTVLIMRPGMQEQMSWLIDFTGWSLSTNVSVKTARDITNILQNHYPERLAIAFLYNPPRIFEAFWKIVKYFLDTKTFQKVKFVYPKNKDSVELMRSLFDVENLPSEFGGNATLKYDHEEFSKLMAQDDVKTASFWGFEGKPCYVSSNGYSGVEAAREAVRVGPPAS
ncbi:uncharacterized protein LOC131148678 isoform X3 [Malania oleifera]|uniref:uncharacterized protein LOC131148678 isoform X3 n=1 Tax=Malania oleifera TaxID=397392 RepID=UPI0025AEC0C9|nr:uncharacterized protein LOC131148678 isoform X3 [Malania oleifera]